MTDGIRTRDRRDHNPELYQLSYGHREPGKDSRRWRPPTASAPRDVCGYSAGLFVTSACGATVRSGSSGSSSAQTTVNANKGTHHR